MRSPARGRGHLAPLLAGLFLAVGSSGRSALAQVAEGGTASPLPEATRVVDVTIVDGGDDADILMDTIRELVGRLGLGVVPHRVSRREAQSDAGLPRGLSVWIDLASRYEVVTLVRNGPTEVRRTIPRDASPAIVREEIGEAVRSAVESQLLADEAPPAPPPASAPIALPAPPPSPIVAESPSPALSPSHGVALDMTILAGAGPIAAGSGLVAHVAGGLVVASRRAWRPSVTLTAEYVFQFDSTLSDVTTHASLVALRAVPAIEVLHRSWVAVDVGVGGGVDAITVDANKPPMSQTITVSTDIRTGFDPMLTARVTAYVALAPGVALTLVAGSDFDVAPQHYAINGVGGGDILVPWRVRPALLAGFTFTALGSGLFAARTP
jgi:hypothetical protein